MRKTKRQKLETDCTSFKKENENLHTVTKKQAKTIVSLKTGKKGYRSSKQWSDYNRAYRSVKKKQVVSGMRAALSIHDEQFTTLSVEVENTESSKREIIDLQKGTFTESANLAEPQREVSFALYVKDKFSLRIVRYLSLHQLFLVYST